eukprot:scpid77784/ scgid4433/ 
MSQRSTVTMDESARFTGLLHSLSMAAEAMPPGSDRLFQETALLREFCHLYSNVKDFNSHQFQQQFPEVLRMLTINRLLKAEWVTGVDHEYLVPYLQVLRILLRDKSLKKVFTNASGVAALCMIMNELTQIYMEGREGAPTALAIFEAGSGFMKLVSEPAAYKVLTQNKYPQIISRLLRVDEERMQRVGLKCICAFLTMKRAILHFIGLDCVVDLLNILERCPNQESKRLAAQVVLHFAGNDGGRQDLLESDALSIIAPELDCKDAKTLQCLVYTIHKLASCDKAVLDEFRMIGGIQTLVDCLRVLNGGEPRCTGSRDESPTGASAPMTASPTDNPYPPAASVPGYGASRPNSAETEKPKAIPFKASFSYGQVMPPVFVPTCT